MADRYTSSRIPFLEPLLNDKRPRRMPGAEHYRYRDTAVAHLTSTVNVDFMGDREGSKREQWDFGAAKAFKWHETARCLGRGSIQSSGPHGKPICQ